jgi:hypothetical protein
MGMGMGKDFRLCCDMIPLPARSLALDGFLGEKRNVGCLFAYEAYKHEKVGEYVEQKFATLISLPCERVQIKGRTQDYSDSHASLQQA